MPRSPTTPPRPTRDDALALLADVFERAGSAHHPAGILAGLGDALARHGAGWTRIELAHVRRGGDALDALVLDAGRAAVPARERRPLADSPVARAIASRPAGQSVVPAGDGASVLLLLPVGPWDDDDTPACVVVALAPSARVPDDALADALARALRVALANARRVARVAAVSRRAHAEREHLRGELARAAPDEPVVAASAAMRRVLDEAVELVARQDTTVLLRGETGTGKELVARRIHARSRRAARPFLQVNCAALPEALVESALFGHEKGAFTGADRRHAGVFERAHGGTLLLDEVAELPLASQAKLLRVLQERALERVGGEAVVRVDVRVIGATHRSLEDLVARGAFREDLYYRLNVFPIVLPPLRERCEDIPLLVSALLARLAARHGRAAPAVPPAALARLCEHDWPGNVRELENALERALVLSPGRVLALPVDFPPPKRATPAVAGDVGSPGTYADEARATIVRALAASRGRIYGAGGAAARLGLKPSTLQSKMQKLGVRRGDFAR